jgi:hypothetical protein
MEVWRSLVYKQRNGDRIITDQLQYEDDTQKFVVAFVKLAKIRVYLERQ